MHINNYTLPTPPDELLACCERVELDGEGKRFWELKRWCRDNELSLVWSENLDMSDISSWAGPDDLMAFYFIEPRDATLFRLRWA